MTAKQLYENAQIGDVVNGKHTITKVRLTVVVCGDKKFSTHIRARLPGVQKIHTVSRNKEIYYKTGKIGGAREINRDTDRRISGNK
jgi:hypothetical protein